MIIGKAEEDPVAAHKRQQAIKEVAADNVLKSGNKDLKYLDSFFEMFQWKVARSHADFFIFETFRRNCPPLVVKSAILKMNKDKKQWLTKTLAWDGCFDCFAQILEKKKHL